MHNCESCFLLVAVAASFASAFCGTACVAVLVWVAEKMRQDARRAAREERAASPKGW
jgi:hypothetical protein